MSGAYSELQYGKIVSEIEEELKMKKIILLLFILSILASLSACNTDSTDMSFEEPDREIDLKGEITKIDESKNRFLMVGSGQLSEGEAEVWMNVHPHSELYNDTGEEINFEDLESGIEVEVWVEGGIVIDTDPGQGEVVFLKVIQ